MQFQTMPVLLNGEDRSTVSMLAAREILPPALLFLDLDWGEGPGEMTDTSGVTSS